MHPQGKKQPVQGATCGKQHGRIDGFSEATEWDTAKQRGHRCAGEDNASGQVDTSETMISRVDFTPRETGATHWRGFNSSTVA